VRSDPDKPTALMPRDRLMSLLDETAHPAEATISPLAVLAVIGVFLALFIAITRL
jgi:hypothetical protein